MNEHLGVGFMKLGSVERSRGAVGIEVKATIIFHVELWAAGKKCVKSIAIGTGEDLFGWWMVE